MSALSQPTVHLSTILRSPLLDRAGERLGRVDDLIVRDWPMRLPAGDRPAARIGGRLLFVPADRIARSSLARGAPRREAQPRPHSSAAPARCCCARTCSATG